MEWTIDITSVISYIISLVKVDWIAIWLKGLN